MQRVQTLVFKGFIIPNGYQLVIDTDDGQVVKQAGEHSGGNYTFQDVWQGRVNGWELRRFEENNEEDYDPIQIDDELYNIVTAVQQAGGRPLFVGGVVRDKILGRPNKDIDVEIYGLEPDALTEVLGQFGKVDTVGASFGVIKLTTENQDYDFTLPRRESKEGKGHRGFIVNADPHMSYEDAAARRDFTFNALAMTPEGKLLDFYQGLRDIKERRLRHTSVKFAEDPLRVLRGFQFAARFNMTIDPATAQLAASLRSEYGELAKERIWGEWWKWATKGVKPSAGLKVLRDTQWIQEYPQLNELIGIPQDPEWHPEGDVWTHTLHVADAAADIADRDNLEGEERAILILAALCHDLGKPTTTIMSDGRWRAPKHPQEGVLPTQKFLESIGAPRNVIESVVPLVAEHMSHLNDITPRSVKRLAIRLQPSNIQMLARVIEADHSGRPPLPKELPERAKDMLMMAHQVKVEAKKPSPIVGGKDLMELAKDGMIPSGYAKGGPHFGKLLNELFEAQLDGAFDTPEEGRQYVIQMFDTEGLDTETEVVKFLAELSGKDKATIIDYANNNNMTEEDLLRQPLDGLKKLLE